MSSRYLLDANVFVEAKDRYYGFDICPGFWASLIAQNESKRVFSIDKIENELRGQDDQITTWMNSQASESFFKKTQDQAVVRKYGELVKWVYAQPQFSAGARDEFARAADGWVVAFAAVNGMIVVTHEQYRPDAKSRVLIPNVCVEFEVKYVNTFEMLHALNERFIRSTKQR